MKSRIEAVNKELDILSEVSNWALREGFEADFLWMLWDSWVEELYLLRQGWSSLSLLSPRTGMSPDRSPSGTVRGRC